MKNGTILVLATALVSSILAPAAASAQQLESGRLYVGIGGGASAAALISSSDAYFVVSGLPELRLGVAVSARSQVYASAGCTLLSAVTSFASDSSSRNAPPSTSVTALDRVPISAALGFSTSLGDSPITFSGFAGYGNFLRGDDPAVQGLIASVSFSVFINTMLGGRS